MAKTEKAKTIKVALDFNGEIMFGDLTLKKGTIYELDKEEVSELLEKGYVKEIKVGK